MLTQKVIRYIVWTAMAENWNKWFTPFEDQAEVIGPKGLILLILILTLEYFILSQWVPVLFLLIYFYHSLNTCSGYTRVWQQNLHLSDIWHSTFKVNPVQLRSVSEFVLKSLFLWVIRSPIRSDFHASAKATCYSVNIALLLFWTLTVA